MSFINLLRTRSGSISQREIYNVKIVETDTLPGIIEMLKRYASFPADADINWKDGCYIKQRTIVDVNTNADIQYVLSDGFTMSISLTSTNLKLKFRQDTNNDGSTFWVPSLPDILDFTNISEGWLDANKLALQTALLSQIMDRLRVERLDSGNVEETYSQTFNAYLRRVDNQVVITSPVTIEYSKDANASGFVSLRTTTADSEIIEADYLPILEGAADSTFELEVKINAV